MRFPRDDGLRYRVTSGLGELSVTPQAARHDLEQAALESDTTVQVVARAPYPPPHHRRQIHCSAGDGGARVEHAASPRRWGAGKLFATAYLGDEHERA